MSHQQQDMSISQRGSSGCRLDREAVTCRPCRLADHGLKAAGERTNSIKLLGVWLLGRVPASRLCTRAAVLGSRVGFPSNPQEWLSKWHVQDNLLRDVDEIARGGCACLLHSHTAQMVICPSDTTRRQLFGNPKSIDMTSDVNS